MTTTFNWQVARMEAKPQVGDKQNVVSVVHWIASATDGTHTTQVYGSHGLPLSETGEFVQYDNLTQEQVLAWIWATGVDKDFTETNMQQQLDTLANPPTISPPLPW